MTDFKIFGISMQRQSTRRKLVVYSYVGLAAVCCLSVVESQNSSGAFAWSVYAALAVGIYIFGGAGSHGLIKNFLNKPPQQSSTTVNVIKLQLNPMSVGTPETPSWLNDERELSRRDRAHFLAFPIATIPGSVILLVAAFAIRAPHWLSVHAALLVIFAASLVIAVFSVTLPSAIILWTEPDLDVPDSVSEEVVSS